MKYIYNDFNVFDFGFLFIFVLDQKPFFCIQLSSPTILLWEFLLALFKNFSNFNVQYCVDLRNIQCNPSALFLQNACVGHYSSTKRWTVCRVCWWLSFPLHRCVRWPLPLHLQGVGTWRRRRCWLHQFLQLLKVWVACRAWCPASAMPLPMTCSRSSSKWHYITAL